MRESTASTTLNKSYDYNNAGWPRDFDIRIEVAEQQEIIRDNRWLNTPQPKHRSNKQPTTR